MSPATLRLAALAAAGLLAAPPAATAGLVVTAQTKTAAPGTTGHLELLLKNDSAASATLSGFSVEVTLGGTGVELTGVDKQTTPAHVFGVDGLVDLTFDGFPNTTFLLSDVSLNPDGFVTLAAGQEVGLARIAFKVDAGAAPGLRALTLTSLGDLTEFTDAANERYTAAQVTLRDGGVDVVSAAPIPEPGVAVMMFAGLGGVGAVLRGRSARRTA